MIFNFAFLTLILTLIAVSVSVQNHEPMQVREWISQATNKPKARLITLYPYVDFINRTDEITGSPFVLMIAGERINYTMAFRHEGDMFQTRIITSHFTAGKSFKARIFGNITLVNDNPAKQSPLKFDQEFTESNNATQYYGLDTKKEILNPANGYIVYGEVQVNNFISW